MYHHDQRDYQTAVTEAVRAFQAKLDKQIADGRGSAGALIQRIQDEVPADRIVNTKALQFTKGSDGRAVHMIVGEGGGQMGDLPLHKHALAQVAARAGMPISYVNDLLDRGEFGAGLLADNLQRLFAHDPNRRQLVRTIKREVRGFLSDKFRRLDSRPIIDAFAQACQAIGAEPVDGVGGDTRIAIRAILPMVFEPIQGEAVAYGVQIANSDFGNGALSVRAFMMRLWCTNYATTDEALREVHLGKRLGDDVAFSARTYDLDTRAMASAVDDVIRGSLAPAKVNELNAMIAKAAAQEVDTHAMVPNLQRKLGLLKGEAEAVRDCFNGAGIEQLPPGNTSYRLSNAVSWVAKTAPTPERRLELEQCAGKLLAA